MDTDWLLTRAFLESHPADTAVVLERIPSAEAAPLLEKIRPQVAASVLQEMVPMSAAECLVRMTPPQGGLIIAALPANAAAALLRRVDEEARDRLLSGVPAELSDPLRRLLHYPEGTAGSLMDVQAPAFPMDLTAGDVLARVKRSPEHALYYVYVVDRDQRLVGVLNLRELMLVSSKTLLASVMHSNVARLSGRADFASVVAHPGWREYHALPVVDDTGVFAGVIRYETLRRLEENAAGRRATNPTLSAMLSLGELCWIGFAGMLAGLAATVFPRVIEDKESGDGAKR